MRVILIFLLSLGLQLNAGEFVQGKVIRVVDNNGEQLSGAKIELLGTGKVFYTNSKGECFVPLAQLQMAKSVKIECISYKPIQLKSLEIKTDIILEFR